MTRETRPLTVRLALAERTDCHREDRFVYTGLPTGKLNSCGCLEDQIARSVSIEGAWGVTPPLMRVSSFQMCDINH